MNNIEIQTKLVDFGFLDTPIDGAFGDQSRRALAYFQQLKGIGGNGKMNDATLQALTNTTEAIPLHFQNNFASHIIKYMLAKKYFVARGKRLLNIAYVEDCDSNFNPVPNARNLYNDRERS